jgi:hypothetical protein
VQVLRIAIACFVELDFIPFDSHIADEIPRCCNCRGCTETYAKRSKLARLLNVYDGINTGQHATMHRMVKTCMYNNVMTEKGKMLRLKIYNVT